MIKSNYSKKCLVFSFVFLIILIVILNIFFIYSHSNINEKNNNNYDNSDIYDDINEVEEKKMFEEDNEMSNIIITKEISNHDKYSINVANSIEPYFSNFLLYIRRKTNISKNGLYVNFNDNAKILLIGDSQDVESRNSQRLNENFDVIGIGGSTIKPLYYSLENITNKKYGKIVLLCMINDFSNDVKNSIMPNDITNIKLKFLIYKAKQHLNYGGTVYYIHNEVGRTNTFKRFYDIEISSSEKMIRKLNDNDAYIVNPMVSFNKHNSNDGIHLNNDNLYDFFIYECLYKIQFIDKNKYKTIIKIIKLSKFQNIYI